MRSAVFPFDLLAQCPALRVLMLGDNVVLGSLGTPQEAAETLERSGLQELHFASVHPEAPVKHQVFLSAAARHSEGNPECLEACMSQTFVYASEIQIFLAHRCGNSKDSSC